MLIERWRNLSAHLPGRIRYLTLVALLLFFIVLLRTAWVCDDAYITLRTIDNLVHGYGLTWNIGERVQTYTHPLWMILLALFYFVTREAFLTTIALSLAVSLAAVALFASKISRSAQAAILGIFVFALSKSFTDFSTSGLENPLSHLLLALFVIAFLKSDTGPRSLD